MIVPVSLCPLDGKKTEIITIRGEEEEGVGYRTAIVNLQRIRPEEDGKIDMTILV